MVQLNYVIHFHSALLRVYHILDHIFFIIPPQMNIYLTDPVT